MWLTEYNNGIRIYKQWVSWNNKKSNQEPFWALGFKINIRLQVVASGTTRIRRQKLNRSDSTATERKHETTYFVRSWDSSFSILIRLRSGRPRFDCRNGRGCFLRHRVQTGSVVHQPPIQWVPRSLFSRVKRRGVKLTVRFQLLPMSRMRGTVPPLPTRSSWRGAELGVDRLEKQNATQNFEFLAVMTYASRVRNVASSYRKVVSDELESAWRKASLGGCLRYLCSSWVKPWRSSGYCGSRKNIEVEALEFVSVLTAVPLISATYSSKS